MIKYAFAAEFDIQYGSIIKAAYPTNMKQKNFNDSLLSGYMIPEGAHKREYDTNTFKFHI